MKERECKIEGYLKHIPTGKESFPEKIAEIKSYLEAQKIDEKQFINYAWRGRTLSFQAGALLTEEQKAQAKKDRALTSEALKLAEQGAKDAGVDLISFVRMAIVKKEKEEASK